MLGCFALLPICLPAVCLLKCCGLLALLAVCLLCGACGHHGGADTHGAMVPTM